MAEKSLAGDLKQLAGYMVEFLAKDFGDVVFPSGLFIHLDLLDYSLLICFVMFYFTVFLCYIHLVRTI